jgi:hypothetical protein
MRMRSPFSISAIAPPAAASGDDVPDRQARGAAREAPVGQQRAGLAETLGLQVAGGVQHLLHARAAARALVAHDHHVAFLHQAVQDVRRPPSSWLSQMCAGPSKNSQIDSSTPAVFTTQPSRAMLP